MLKFILKQFFNKLVFDLEELKSFYKEDTVSPFIGLEIYKLKDYLSSKYNLSIKKLKIIENFLLLILEKVMLYLCLIK